MSIIRDLLAPSELVSPGKAKIRVDWFDAASSIEFKFKGIIDKPLTVFAKYA